VSWRGRQFYPLVDRIRRIGFLRAAQAILRQSELFGNIFKLVVMDTGDNRVISGVACGLVSRPCYTTFPFCKWTNRRKPLRSNSATLCD